MIISILIGYIIITFRLRQEDYRSDLRAADLTDIDDIYSVYEVFEQLATHKQSQNKFIRMILELLSSHPPIKKRKEYLKKFAIIQENEVLAFEKYLKKK